MKSRFFRKLCCFSLAGAMMCTSLTVPVMAETEVETEQINYMDSAIAVLECYAKTACGIEHGLSEETHCFLDVDSNGIVDVLDGIAFLEMYAKTAAGLEVVPPQIIDPEPTTQPTETTIQSVETTTESSETTEWITTEDITVTTTLATTTDATTVRTTTTVKTATKNSDTTTQTTSTTSATSETIVTSTTPITTTTTKAMSSVLYRGIDVSVYQGDIDWKAAKADGVEFAIIRAGYGKYASQEDKKFDQNMQNAQEAGIPCGAYWFSYALTPEAAIQEADACYEVIKEYEFQYPIAFDVEYEKQAALSKEEVSAIIDAFCTRLQSYGYYTTVYSYTYFLNTKVTDTILDKYDVWVAHYNTERPSYQKDYTVWQYSSTGTIDGITGSVDLDYAYVDYEEIIQNTTPITTTATTISVTETMTSKSGTTTAKATTISVTETTTSKSGTTTAKATTSESDTTTVKATTNTTTTITGTTTASTVTTISTDTSIKAYYDGIDVSVYQGTIDWEAVKADGIDFAIMRAGYGKYASQKDKNFDQNMQNAQAADIPCGAYWFSYALTPEAAIQEADACYEVIKTYDFQYPIAFDIEYEKQAALSKEEVSAIIDAFCGRMESYGYFTTLYSYANMLNTKVEDPIFEKYNVWVAHYNTSKPAFDRPYGMWQYSCSGEVDGISTPVDLNYAYLDYEDIISNMETRPSVTTTKTTTTTTKATETTTKNNATTAKATTTQSNTTTQKTTTKNTTTTKATTIKTSTTTIKTTATQFDTTTTKLTETTVTTTQISMPEGALYAGIDVSVYQGDIDWSAVKENGVEFAIIRAGYGKYASQEDKNFDQNMQEAQAAGIPCGAYWFSYALTPEAAIQEADACYEVIKEYQLEYPIAFDMETEAQMELSSDEVSAIIDAFCSRMESYGYYTALYSYANFLNTKVNESVFAKYDTWVAHYNTSKPAFQRSYGMWQYSCTGTVDGIDGSVDLDFVYIDYEEIIKRVHLNGF